MTRAPAQTDAPEDPLLALAERVRSACLDAACRGYEDASISGLCREGALELAVDAIRRLDLAAILPADPDPAPASLAQAASSLAERFARPGAPAAGSAAAATAALAAGLLQWTADLSAERGPQAFRRRARALSARAATLRVALAGQTQRDAEHVEALLGAASRARPAEARRRADESLLEVAARCGEVATLAAELSTQGHPPARPDAAAALRLTRAACESALALAEQGIGDADGEWERGARRRAWRTRLLLARAARMLPAEDGD